MEINAGSERRMRVDEDRQSAVYMVPLTPDSMKCDVF
jgi:hypothetical protein